MVFEEIFTPITVRQYGIFRSAIQFMQTAERR